MRNPEDGWHFYAMATAAENKRLGDPHLEVNLTDISNYFDGPISSKGERENFDYQDGDGVAKSGQAIKSQSVPAIWRATEANRITAPDVRRGEQLIIWRYSDSEQLFWETRNTNRHLRKLETVTHAYSGTTNENDKTVTSDNHYIYEVSTHKGHIVLSTSMANGEVCKWNLQLLGKEGKFVISDGDDEILIDKTKKQIRLLNADNTFIEAIGKDVNVTNAGNTTVNTTGNVTVNGGNVTVNSKGSATVEAKESATVTAPIITLNGKTQVNGELEVTGATKLQNTLAVTGHASFPGGHSPPD